MENVFTPIKGVDYDVLNYQAIRVNMIYADSPEFEEILERVAAFSEKAISTFLPNVFSSSQNLFFRPCNRGRAL
jgi:hypothetical protein